MLNTKQHNTIVAMRQTDVTLAKVAQDKQHCIDYTIRKGIAAYRRMSVQNIKKLSEDD